MSTITVRALTTEEMRALSTARLVAVEYAPYLAHALFSMHAVAAEGLGTLAVDRSWRLYVDPTVVAEWGPRVTGGGLVHEVSHLIRDHAGRAAHLGTDRDHPTWNYATDAAINDDLLAAGVPLPDGVITPDALGLPPGGIEEAYYELLRQTPPQDDTNSGGDGGDASDDAGGCGSGAGDPVATWELPADDPQAPGLTPGDATMARRIVAQAIRDHAHSGRGSLPAGLTRWAEQELLAPTVAWRRVLGSSVRRAVAWARGGGDYTYSRPGRRQIPRVITPALRRPKVTVAVVIDTSASMSEGQLTAALSEIQGVIRAAGLGARGLAVLTCDAAVASTSEVRRVGAVRLGGGGGTDMRVGIAAAQARRPAPDVIVVLTDGFTPWPAQPTRARLVIGLIGAHVADPTSTPPWATTVLIPATG